MSEDVHALVGLYVVDALDDDERRQFEEHLAGCPACSAEVVEFRSTTSRLSELMAENPPPALRSAIMERVGGVRQVSPGGSVTEARRRRAPVRWVAPALAAAAALIAVVLGIGWSNAHRSLDRQQSVTAVLTAPDAESVPLSGAPGTMRVVYSPSRDRSVVVADGLADLPGDETYQLWFIDADGNPASAGLFRTDGGRATKVLTGTPADAAAVGVTKEPAGGSKTPTLPILMSGDVV
jgi:anti-sigma-K factor RskA